jgi:dUTP pyrophosphatase
MDNIDVQITTFDSAVIPTYGTPESAGCDIYSIEDGVIEPGKRSGLIPTGIAMKIPQGYYCNIEPRSSLAHRYGISVLGGIIDSDYVNQIYIILQNNGDVPFIYKRGDRIAQFIFKKYAKVTFKKVDILENTQRLGGFGSTDQNRV